MKILLPMALIAVLCHHVWRQHPEAIQALRAGGTRLTLILAAGVWMLLAHVLAMIRWHLLMRALHIPMRLRDTLRLGFLAHLLNFVSPGQVGGDLFKALFVAREQPEQRTEAVATIVVDRVCGLLGLLLVASVATASLGIARLPDPLPAIVRVIWFTTAFGLSAVTLALLPGVATRRWARWLERLPRVGRLLKRLLSALQMYQSQRAVLAIVGTLSLGVHLATAAGVYCVSAGLYREVPTWAEHLVISPLAGSVAALPLTPGGLGSFELAFSFLYDRFTPPAAQGRGLIVGIVVHLAIISCAVFGVFFYWLNHREVQQLLRSADASGKRESMV